MLKAIKAMIADDCDEVSNFRKTASMSFCLILCKEVAVMFGLLRHFITGLQIILSPY